MTTRRWVPGILLVSCGVLLGSLWASGGTHANVPAAQEPAAGVDHDLEAVKSAANRYSTAFNARDAAAIARLFTDDGEFVDGSQHVVHGRQAIEAAFAEFFRNSPRSTLTIDMDVVRRLGATALVEEGTYSFAGEQDDPSPVDRSRYVMLHVKQNDGWRIASVRCDRDTHTSGREQLAQLEWLVGTWVDEGANEVIRSTWNWSEDGQFLLGNFVVESKGRLVMKGSQRLGWDGSRRQIRSWVFDSEGGFVEGFWHRTGYGAWLVKGSGVNSDGETTSQTTVYEPRGKDRFQLTMRDRVDGDEVLPDIIVTISRAAAAPKE